MADPKKNYAFRLSEEVVALIDKQKGDSRTEKLENLVIKKDKELESLEKRIIDANNTLSGLRTKIDEYRSIINNLREIERYVEWATNHMPSTPASE